MLYLSTLLLLTGISLLGLSHSNRKQVLCGLIPISLSLLTLLLYIGVNTLTENGLDESFFYHLEENLTGADLMAFDGALPKGIAAHLLAIGLSLILIIWLRTKRPHYSARLYGAAISTLLLSLFINPTTTGFYKFYFSKSVNDIGSYYVAPSTQDTGANKNLIYIYLESMEAAYFDETRFPGLTPNLKNLMKTAVVFDNVGQTFGAEWTIAGMVASQCGIPLSKPGKFVTAHGLSSFLPKATCLGDTLKQQGYQLNYLAGADLAFAAKGTFYQSHGFERVEGFTQLKSSDYKTDWGLYDDTTFKLLEERFNQLAKNHKPFALFSLTLDTHSPFEVSASCKGYPYRDGKEGMLNAVHCTDKLIGQLISRLAQNSAYKDTLIVIGSDHTGINVSNLVGHGKNHRNNFLMMLNTEHAAQTIPTQGTTLDIAATVLHAMGQNTRAYGLGRSLLDPKPTLASSIPNFDLYVSGGRSYFHQFWSFPSARHGIHITPTGQQASMEDSTLKAPFLLSFDRTLNLRSQFHPMDGRGAITRYFTELGFGERFVWLDNCKEMQAKQYPAPYKDQCIAIGRMGGNVKVTPITTATYLSQQDLLDTFDHWPNPWQHLREKAINENLRDLGIAHPFRPYNIKGTDRKLTISSSTQATATSQIRHQDFGALVEIPSGFRVVGMKHDALPQALYHQGNCQSNPTSLHKLLATKGAEYDLVAIVYRDQADCPHAFFEHFFQGSGLSQWPAIFSNAPYIALLQAGKTEEFTGPSNSPIALRF